MLISKQNSHYGVRNLLSPFTGSPAREGEKHPQIEFGGRYLVPENKGHGSLGKNPRFEAAISTREDYRPPRSVCVVNIS